MSWSILKSGPIDQVAADVRAWAEEQKNANKNPAHQAAVEGIAAVIEAQAEDTKDDTSWQHLVVLESSGHIDRYGTNMNLTVRRVQ